MRIEVPDDLLRISHQIVSEGRTDTEWSAIESDDMFQEQSVHGGYDATEQAFCFSYYRPGGRELGVRLMLDEVAISANGELRAVEARLAE